MDLNLFENRKNDIDSNKNVENFLEEVTKIFNNITSAKLENNNEKELNKNRKEGHLYLVTEDRNNEVYLWDFTDKPKHEFVEKNLPEDILKVAKEGAMLQYKNGKYELYSKHGYHMLENEQNN